MSSVFHAAALAKSSPREHGGGMKKPRPSMHHLFASFATVALLASSTPAAAGELFAGLHVHDVKTPLDESGLESGIDFSLGFRGGTIAHLGKGTLQPYVFGALNSAGNTNY